MKLYGFDTVEITKLIVEKISEVTELTVVLTNPSTKAHFPVCLVAPPLQREVYSGAGLDLSITVEVWGARQYDTIRLFDEVRKKLSGYRFKLTNNTALHKDEITDKWRFGGYFECRWNAILNAFERN